MINELPHVWLVFFELCQAPHFLLQPVVDQVKAQSAPQPLILAKLGAQPIDSTPDLLDGSQVQGFYFCSQCL